jgi:hypothetical protein
VIEDEPINTTVQQFTIHRDKTDTNNRVLFYLNRSEGSEGYGKIHITNGTFTGYIDADDTSLDMHPVDTQGDGVPEPGSTTTPDGYSCGDEVYVNSSDQDFNLVQCGHADAWFASWEATGPDPTINVTFRKSVTISSSPYIGGDAPTKIQEGAEIPLLAKDSDEDNDGIPDYIENSTYHLANTNISVTTDWNDNDTDDDGIDDGNETLVNKDRIGGGYQWNSNPNAKHTDNDLINDGRERDGWRISTINRTVTYNGVTRDTYSWDYANKTSANITVTADPKNGDTDADGVHDGNEKRRLHTHPRRNITYGLTLEHQDRIIDPLAEKGVLRIGSVRGVGIAEDTRALKELQLNDSSDDFDFVYDRSSTETGLSLITYRSYPGELEHRGTKFGGWTNRTDTWLTNSEELTRSGRTHQTESIWDPDIDNDGLTDGQERKAITHADRFRGKRVIVAAPASDTSPTDADSDHDGYWDGWIGVYNASNSRDVILYPEHLKTGDGIEGTENVSEQVGTHPVKAAPSGRNATINGTDRHSNIHLGERHWGTDPADQTDTPVEQTQVTIEVDYHESVNETRFREDVFPVVRRTYALYGMDVEFVIDDRIQNDRLRNLSVQTTGGGSADYDARPPTNLGDAQVIESTYHNDSSAAYLFISPNGGENQWPMEDWVGVEGVASSQGASVGLGFGTLVFTEDHGGRGDGPLNTHLAKTTTHEVGHLLGTGRADDGQQYVILPREVYSGDPDSDDPTIEEVILESIVKEEWSAMSRSWNDAVNFKPMAGRYIAFSIEELSTLEFEDIQTREGN